MFKYHIRKLEDLKDSRLLFDKKPPEFGYIVLLLVVGMCIFCFIWSMNAFKKYIVKAQGTITSENSIDISDGGDSRFKALYSAVWNLL